MYMRTAVDGAVEAKLNRQVYIIRLAGAVSGEFRVYRKSTDSVSKRVPMYIILYLYTFMNGIVCVYSRYGLNISTIFN